MSAVDQIRRACYEAVGRGDAEIVGVHDGEPVFRITLKSGRVVDVTPNREEESE